MTGRRNSTSPALTVRNAAAQTGRAGFTLMEIIIAVAVFSVAMLIATGIFLLATQSQLRTSAEQVLQSDARYVLEALTRSVKYAAVDYDCYETNTQCDPLAGGTISLDDEDVLGLVNVLALRDADGTRKRFRAFGEVLYQCTMKAAVDPEEYCNDEPGQGAYPSAWQPLTPAGIAVQRAAFTVHPFLDPLATDATGVFLSDEQPRVTVVYSTAREGSYSRDDRITLQTTVTSRLYAR